MKLNLPHPELDALYGHLEADRNLHGWHVIDSTTNAVWWPNVDAADQVTRSGNPAATILLMCVTDPMSGTWRT